jgi:hypothetical protein
MNSERDANHSENHKHNLVMPKSRAALANLLTKIRRGEAGFDVAAEFLDETKGAPPASGV